MTTVDTMLDATHDIWESYYTHPFVQGMQDGTLDEKKFRYYILQDYLYLEEFAKVFAVGVAKAKSLEMANLFMKYIPVMNGELDVHQGYLARLGVTQEEVDSTPRALNNLSYTSYMLRVAYEECEAEILAAILSCAYSYQLIAEYMVKNNPQCVDHELYGEWIMAYDSQAYKEDNAILLAKMNELTEHYTQEQIDHLVDIFIACSRYELDFWDMGWSMKKIDGHIFIK